MIGLAILGAALLSGHGHQPQASCPAGVPTQTITVVNQANARPWALAKVENAAVAQSMQLRAAWETPCVQFGPGGWPLHLLTGSPTGAHGDHSGGPGIAPNAFVWTSGNPWPSWSATFSHEIVEMLVDPQITLRVFHDGKGAAVEVADPVEDEAYRLDGVYVTDFVLPSWFSGGMQTASCQGSVCLFSDPLPGSDAGAPYDYMHAVAGAWRSAPSLFATPAAGKQPAG